MRYLRGIEQTTGLTCTGLVNNTHCAAKPPPGDRKARPCAAVREATGTPVICHMAEQRFADSLSDLPETVFPITIQMKKPWE